MILTVPKPLRILVLVFMNAPMMISYTRSSFPRYWNKPIVASLHARTLNKTDIWSPNQYWFWSYDFMVPVVKCTVLAVEQKG